MDGKAKAEINSIIQDLNRIIKDINQTASQLNTIKGIGTEHCSQKLYRVAEHYRNTVNKLQGLK